jgi:hypothetical protein
VQLLQLILRAFAANVSAAMQCAYAAIHLSKRDRKWRNCGPRGGAACSCWKGWKSSRRNVTQTQTKLRQLLSPDFVSTYTPIRDIAQKESDLEAILFKALA